MKRPNKWQKKDFQGISGDLRDEQGKVVNKVILTEGGKWGERDKCRAAKGEK